MVVAVAGVVVTERSVLSVNVVGLFAVDCDFAVNLIGVVVLSETHIPQTFRFRVRASRYT